MFWLLLLFFVEWCLMRLVQTDQAKAIVLIIGLVLAAFLAFGAPHLVMR